MYTVSVGALNHYLARHEQDVLSHTIGEMTTHATFQSKAFLSDLPKLALMMTRAHPCFQNVTDTVIWHCLQHLHRCTSLHWLMKCLRHKQLQHRQCFLPLSILPRGQGLENAACVEKIGSLITSSTLLLHSDLAGCPGFVLLFGEWRSALNIARNGELGRLSIYTLKCKSVIKMSGSTS